MPSLDFRRYLDAAARGYTGGYDRFRAEGYTPQPVVYRPPNLSRAGFRAEHLAPIPGGTGTANLTRFASARGRGFEGSYIDFLQHGYTRWTPTATGGRAHPAMRDALPTPAAPSPRATSAVNLGPVATELWLKMEALEGALYRLRGPRQLRRVGDEPAGPGPSLQSALLDERAPNRGPRLPFSARPPLLEKYFRAGYFALVIPELTTRVAHLEKELASAQLDAARAAACSGESRYDPQRPNRSLQAALLGEEHIRRPRDLR